MGRESGLAVMLLATLLAMPTAALDHAAVLDSLAVQHAASRPDQVDRLAGPAIAEARAEADSLALCSLLLARGRSRAAFGMARAAEPDLHAALALATAADDTLVRLRCVRWLSVAVGLQGRGAEAAALHRQLEGLAAAAGDSVHLAWARIGRAYDHYLAGRADSSAVLYADAGGMLARAGISRGAIWAWNGEGMARRLGGDFRGAAAGFQRALQQARASGDALNEALALNSLGRLELHFGDPGRAEAMFARAAEIHHAHQHHREELLPRIDMAEARILAGRPEAAAALLDSIMVDARVHGLADLEVLASNHLAEVLLELDRPGAAAATCRRTLQRAEMPSTMAAAEVRIGLALALAARDSLDAALASLESVVESGGRMLDMQLAAIRGRLLLAQGRAAEALLVVRPVAGADRAVGADLLRIPLLTVLGRAWLATGEPDSALAAFDTAVALWDDARAVPEDPAWRERRGLAAGDLFAHAVAAHLDEPRAAPLADRQAAAFELLTRYKARTLLERMFGPGRDLPAPETPATLASLRGGVLAPDDVLLELAQGADLGVVFCVTADTVLTATMPGSRTAAPTLRRLESALASRAISDAGPAERLAAGVLADLTPAMRARLASARRVHWSPDGSLHQLPLALLTGVEGWLAADCELVRVPSAALLSRLRARSLHGGVGIHAIHGSEPGSPAPLPGAAAETRWLAARLRHVTRYQGFEALAPEDPRWREAAVLHLATHVDLDPRQPWQTAVRLAPGPAGRLRACEVATEPVAAQLVVLSGCRTAGSGVVGGEGLLGLGSGFLAAGAPAVLATLWDVDDLVTVRFVADFYGALAEDRTVAGALVVAREACRARPTTAAPRHWAGFVLVGDGSRRVPVERRRPWWPVGVVLAVGAVAAMEIGRRRPV